MYTLLECIYFYISKNITSYTFLLVFKIRSIQCILKANLRIVSFLDIALDLRNNTYDRHNNPENHTVYINISSDVPKTIWMMRNLPKSITKRLSDLSSTKEIFQKAAVIYCEALKKDGFNEPLVFTPKANATDNTSKKQRKHKIKWFILPFPRNVKTNIGRTLKICKTAFSKTQQIT